MCGHPVSRPCSRSMNMKHCSKMRVPRGCNYSKIAWLRYSIPTKYIHGRRLPLLVDTISYIIHGLLWKDESSPYANIGGGQFCLPQPTNYILLYTGNMVSKQIPQFRQFLLGKFIHSNKLNEKGFRGPFSKLICSTIVYQCLNNDKITPLRVIV